MAAVGQRRSTNTTIGRRQRCAAPLRSDVAPAITIPLSWRMVAAPSWRRRACTFLEGNLPLASIDHTGRGAVEITECAGKLCGRIVWLKDAGHKSVCGTQIIGNVKSVGKGIWDGGWIHDPEKNEKYSVELKTVGADKLRVMGYMGSKLFSETFIWKRPTSDLKRCDAPATTATPVPDCDRAETGSYGGCKPRTPPDELPTRARLRQEPKWKPEHGRYREDRPRDAEGQAGGKQCTAKLPYVGNVTIPCPG